MQAQTLILSILGGALGALSVYIYGVIPSKYLCDYKETPSEKHSARNRRLNIWYYAVFTLIGFICTFFASKVYTGLEIIAIPFVIALLFIIALCDIKFTIIPNEICILAVLIGVPIAFRDGWLRPIIGALIVAGVLYLFGVVCSKLFKKDAFGFGDVVLGALAGYLCGFGHLIQLSIITLVCAALSFAVQMIMKKLTIKSSAPFAPYFVCGIISVISFSTQWQIIIDWYFSLFGL